MLPEAAATIHSNMTAWTVARVNRFSFSQHAFLSRNFRMDAVTVPHVSARGASEGSVESIFSNMPAIFLVSADE
jgi:hypothetical protein